MVPLALESCTVWSKMLKVVIIPQCLGADTEGWMLHSQDPIIPSLPQPPLSVCSCTVQEPPPVPQSLPSCSKAVLLSQAQGTDISRVTRMCVASVASVQIHSNGRREKKLCPAFWDSTIERDLSCDVPASGYTVSESRNSNLQLCFSPIY